MNALSQYDIKKMVSLLDSLMAYNNQEIDRLSEFKCYARYKRELEGVQIEYDEALRLQVKLVELAMQQAEG